jgi:hypothetical protein
MALRLALAIAALAALWLAARWVARARPDQVKNALIAGGLVALVAGGAALVLSGKLAGLAAMAAGLSPWIMRAMRVHQAWTAVRRYMAKRNPPPGDDDRDGGSSS